MRRMRREKLTEEQEIKRKKQAERIDVILTLVMEPIGIIFIFGIRMVLFGIILFLISLGRGLPNDFCTMEYHSIGISLEFCKAVLQLACIDGIVAIVFIIISAVQLKKKKKWYIAVLIVNIIFLCYSLWNGVTTIKPYTENKKIRQALADIDDMEYNAAAVKMSESSYEAWVKEWKAVVSAGGELSLDSALPYMDIEDEPEDEEGDVSSASDEDIFLGFLNSETISKFGMELKAMDENDKSDITGIWEGKNI